jgi:hypothetical protein
MLHVGEIVQCCSGSEEVVDVRADGSAPYHLLTLLEAGQECAVRRYNTAE